MKKFTSVFSIFVITAMVATSAFAQAGGGAAGGASGTGGVSAPSTGAAGTPSAGPGSTGSGTDQGGSTSGDAKSKAEPKGAGSAASPSTMASGDFTGRHTMEGEVVKVDQKKGHLTLKTAEGNMDLHFPPSALASVKKGDRISVELAMKPAGSASMKDDKDAKGSASPKTEKKY